MVELKLVTEENRNLAKRLQAEIFVNDKSPEQIDRGILTGNPTNFLAFDGEKPVGIVGFYFKRELPKHVLLNWYGVLEGERQHGYGRAILHEAINTTGTIADNVIIVESVINGKCVYIENSFSMVAGVIDGVRKIKHLNKLAGLDKASNWLMGIGIGINVGLSFYNNLTNSNLTGSQKAGNIVGDIVYIAASSAATWGISALTAMIPVVGPFIAPIVGFGFGTAFDQFWHGENIFGIDGFSLNPGGKSIDKWIKDFLTELFGG